MLLLAVGAEGAESTRHDAATFAQALTQKGWPLTYVVHVGRGHGLHADNLASAWEAWGR